MRGGGAEEGLVRNEFADLMELARGLALRAGEITLKYFGEVLVADEKADGTPVTRADREAETLLRSEIRRLYPDHSILGEEFGEHTGPAPVRWILDPIDGTLAFMRGIPLYAVLIGIEIEGEPVVGVAHFPALDETVTAARDEGCKWWPRGSGSSVSARVSEVGNLENALALTTDPERISVSAVGSGWRSLGGRVELVRGWGDAYGHLLVATGRAEVMVDPSLSPWDAAPLLPIVTESGGRFTDLQGNDTIHGGSGVSTNGRVHQAVLDILREGV